MKRGLLVLVAALFVVAVAPMTRALSTNAGPAAMARFFDAQTPLFLSLRIDDDYLNTLSSVVNRVVGNLPPEVVPPGTATLDLRSLLEAQLADIDISLADVRSLLGDHAAFALVSLDAFVASMDSPTPQGFALAVEVRNRARLVQALVGNLQDINTTEDRGFTIIRPDDSTVLAIGDEVLYIAPARTRLPLGTRMTTLLDTAGFQDAAAAMPAESYNIYAYIAYADLFRALDALGGAAVGISPQLFNLLPDWLAIGATILDGSVLALDVVNSVPPAQTEVFNTPITQAFGAFVPNGVDLLIWSTDLNGYVNYLLDILPESFSASTGLSAEETRREIANALEEFARATGIRLQDDLLSWMNGDFVLYSTLDLEPLVRLLVAGALGTRAPNLPEVPIEFGVVIATDNPTKTAEAVTKLATLVRGVVANATGVRVRNVNEEGFSGIELLITLPLDGPARTANVDILLVSNEALFFFGTTKTAERLLAGDNVLDDPVFNRALRYAPTPNIIQFTYTDAEGFAGLIGIPVAAALTTGIGTGANREAQAAEATAVALQIIDAFIRAVDHSIIATSLTENGFFISRATIALR